MGDLITNLLQLSRIQFGSLSAKFSFLKISNLLKTQVQSMRLHAEDRGLQLEVHVPDNLPPLYGDKDLISVAVSNLVSNALKYTPRGGKVRISAQETDSGVLIEIRDTGIGIPEEMHGKVFERFVRSDQKEVREQSGSGLGLTLVKEIAEVHHGQVSVESVVGAGSRFLLWFPSKEAGSKLDLKAA
jgi:signal transduction histidine kinase